MIKIGITGATGTIGRSLVSLLGAQDVNVRAIVRDPAAAVRTLGAGVEVVPGDLTQPHSLVTALDGVDALFLACGNVPEQVDYEVAVIEAAAQVGVRRVVKLSARGAAFGSPVTYWHWHGLIEQHLRASGVPAVVLQPGFLMTNLLGSAEQVRRYGMIFAPAGHAPIGMVHPADVAAAAVTALMADGHDGRTYVITGPQAITYADVAQELSIALGRPVGYVDTPPAGAGQAMREAGLPPVVVEEFLRVFEALRAGVQAVTTPDAEELIGRRPRPFATFARDHAQIFGALDPVRGEPAPVGT
jgi:uncharacterized protein YbjT (DUF2867 family)